MSRTVSQAFPGLGEALDALDQGLLWLDENLHVQGHNEPYRLLLDIEGERHFVGRHYRDLLQYLLERGEFFESNPERYLLERISSLRQGKPLRHERVRPNGIALSVSAVPLPSGGYVFTYLDVTKERRARESLRRNAKATVVAMANFAEHRDTDTGIHVLRVARLVGQTARKLLKQRKFASIVDEEFVEQIATASILHDVGKISTPDRILLKAGPLTTEEREAIKQHAAVGAQLLKQAKLTMGDSLYLDMGAEIALTHHEWFDGRGYPNGLAGDDIPLAGRICAVADVFDALTSRRPYKAPWDDAAAVALIREQSGSQFDPDVAAAFLEVIGEREAVYLVRWSEAMSVGNTHIDEQHRILLDTINQLASAESLHNHHAVSMIIDELVSYAAFHFDFEEKLMAACGYPDLEAHRSIHQGFVNWVIDFRDEFITYGKRALGEPVLEFLRDWLRDHILGEDQQYRSYLQLKEPGSRGP
ncbi:MAG: bacteriohemerythrin [Actinomycetota bacterium]